MASVRWILEDDAGCFTFQPAAGICLAITQSFTADQPLHFGVPPATREPLRAGRFIGDTRAGGSCNVDVLQLIPHCNGTHTETAGHILSEPVPVATALTDHWLLARLITVKPVPAAHVEDDYQPRPDPDDRVVSADAIGAALAARLPESPSTPPSALIIRTLPNDEGKRRRDWSSGPAAGFLTCTAMEAILAASFQHLLLDLPSVDRTHDEGRMASHCVFWEVDPESRTALNPAALWRTITEMIFVPDEVEDGLWLLNLQVPAFATEAAPSRPVIFRLQRSDFPST